MKTEEEFEQWLKDTISDSFMDLFYYDRKECETMDRERLKEHEHFLTKERLSRLFLEQIEKEFN